MPWLTPTQALLALLVVWALTLLLYLLRPKRRRVIVPFMPLWDALLLPEPTSRLSGRLRRIGSLLIAFSISALLILALVDPGWGSWRRPQQTVVLLIDAGQAMQASDIKPTRLAMARQLAAQLVAAKPSGDPWLIAQLAADVTPLCSMTSDVDALDAALKRVTASDAASDLASGASFATRVLDARTRPRLILISDGAVNGAEPALAQLRAHGIAFEQRLIGKSERNVGIRSLSGRRCAWDKNQSEVLVTLENAGRETERVELTLLADGSPVTVTQLQLTSHMQLSRVFGELPARAERLEARIKLLGARGSDALASDDRAYALLPPVTRTRVLLVSNGNRYIEAALLLDPAHDVTAITPGAYHGASGHDLVIFDAFVADAPPDVPSVYFGLPHATHDFPFHQKGVATRPFFETWQRDHPLLRQLSLRDVNITKAVIVEPHADDHVVAAARGVPLIVTGRRAGQPFVATSFDVRDSDLPLRVAWPLFVTHAIDFLHPPDTDYRPALRVGIEQHIPLRQLVNHVDIVTPQLDKQSVAVTGQAVTLRPEQLGFYRINTPTEQQLWAANRDPEASVSIAPRQLSTAHDVLASAGQRPLPRDAWMLSILLAWSIVFLEWFSYQRRWTV